jgi:hypothetical protein
VALRPWLTAGRSRQSSDTSQRIAHVPQAYEA